MLRYPSILARRGVRTVASHWAARRPRVDGIAPGTWDLRVGPDGGLWRADCSLEQVARELGTPLHLVDGVALDRRAAEAVGASASVQGDGPVVSYSYKTNPVPGVLSRLHAHGIGAEVISPYELWLARRLGVPADRIIYNGPAKSPASLREAVSAGVWMINANSPGDLEAIGAGAREVGRRARVGLRVALPSMWGGQFGLPDDAGGQPVAAVRRALADESTFDLVGLHFHRGFGLRRAADLEGYVREVLAFVDGLEAATGWWPGILDVGGSLTTATVAGIDSTDYRLNRAFGSDLAPPDPTGHLTVGEAAALAHRVVGVHAAARDRPAPTVVLEPGRGLTGDTQLLLTTVLDVKEVGGQRYAVLDAGTNIAEPTSGEYHQVLSVTAPSAPRPHPYRLVGPICTPADVVYNNWRLPDLAPGHVLAIMDTGAYFVPFATSFSFPQPGIALQTADGGVEWLRRPETFEDLVDRDGPPPA